MMELLKGNSLYLTWSVCDLCFISELEKDLYRLEILLIYIS